LLSVKQIASTGDRELAFSIRRKVFVEEQNVDPLEEYDEFEDASIHYLVYSGSSPIATARWRYVGEDIKLERFAVIRDFRNKGVG
jgi:predicted GNAT family N-acyltransferase